MRIFLGLEIDAPWPHDYPAGRLLEEKERHLTLAFLGNVDEAPLLEALETIPKPPFVRGQVGFFDKLLFLPNEHPRVAALHIQWLLDGAILSTYQITLLNWLEKLGYKVDRRPLLSHVTVARAPFKQAEWEKAFTPLPCLVKALHLYESVGNLHYHSRWKIDFSLPFEEIEHTADIAFLIRGENFDQLYIHAGLALCFKFPPLLKYLRVRPMSDLLHVIRALNELISIADLEIGVPFKAVSYHGAFENNCWQMIVDV